jgi:hypothetical protein
MNRPVNLDFQVVEIENIARRDACNPVRVDSEEIGDRSGDVPAAYQPRIEFQRQLADIG